MRVTFSNAGNTVSAVLTFDWKRDAADPFVDSDIYVQVSDNGGAIWTDLLTIPEGTDPGLRSERFDITEYSVSDTRIRFFKENVISKLMKQ